MSDYNETFRKNSKKAAAKKKTVSKKKASNKKASSKKDSGKSQTSKITTENVTASYIEMMVDSLKALWPAFSGKPESDQRAIIETCLPKAKVRIKEIIQFLTTVDYKSAYALVKNVAIKEKVVEVKLHIDLNDPNLHSIVDFANKEVVVVLASPDKYFDDVKLPEADPDQKALNV